MIATRIGYLEWLPVHGDAWSDQFLLMLAHELAVDPREPLEIRLRALHIMDLATGEPSPLTEQALAEYHEFLEIPYRRSAT